MLRQSYRLISKRTHFCTQICSTVAKRGFSSQPPTSSKNDLLLKLVAGGIVLGGSTFIAYSHGFVDSHKPTHAKTEHQEPVVVVDEKLPEKVPYLIIGGGTAAFSASRTIRSNDPKARVLIISAENYYPYMRPPLSKELWYNGLDVEKNFTFTQYNGRDRSVYFEPDEFYLPLKDFETAPNGGISVAQGLRVVKLDATSRIAYLDNGHAITYEKCLIATGGKPRNLEVFDKALPEIQKKVVLFRNLDDFKKLDQVFPKSKSVTIIGGGFLGSELAYALSEKSKRNKSKVQINHLFPESGVLGKVLPQYLSKWCTKKIQAEGVNVIPNTNVKEAQLNNNQLSLTLNNGETLNTDLCIVAVGITPDVDLAQTSMLEVDDVLGGYRVNAELQVRSNLWAAGDSACFYDQKFGRRRVEHHDHAVVSGRLAGENMTGAGKPYFHQSMFWSDLGNEIGFEAVGIIDSSLPTFGVFAKPEKKVEDENSFREPLQSDMFNKGVLFYLKNNSVVGIVLWNLYNNMNIARRVINDGVENQDLNEVAKLFSIYENEETVAEQTTEESQASKAN